MVSEHLSKYDLDTLIEVRNCFSLFSDNSTFCLGYYWLERVIEKLEKEKLEKELTHPEEKINR